MGLDHATLLRRSGLNLAVLAALLTLLTAFLGLLFGDRRADHRRGAYAGAAILLVVMGVGGMVWLLAGFGAVGGAATYFQGCWTMAVLLGMLAALGPMSPSPGWPRAPVRPGGRRAARRVRRPTGRGPWACW